LLTHLLNDVEKLTLRHLFRSSQSFTFYFLEDLQLKNLLEEKTMKKLDEDVDLTRRRPVRCTGLTEQDKYIKHGRDQAWPS
jgi:hypothetical protein